LQHRSIPFFLLCALSTCLAAQKPAVSAPDLLGFTPGGAQTERDWEAKFRAIPEASRAHENMRFLAAHPHNVGSAAQRANAEWMVARYKEWGWDAHIEQFDVLYPTPRTMLLEMVGPWPFKAKLEESSLAEDPYTHEKGLPGYNIYSADGDVTGPLVYVNYGMPDDYAELERNHISVQGAIVITRYGGGWRGLKPKLAYEHGAIGCIIYSDPADDGYVQNDVLPRGPMRPPAGVQRGSVADMPLYPGDPLTPGIGSVPGAKRLAIKDAETIMKIPVLPIGYGDAQPLLAALTGGTVPAAWRGGLPMTYHFGPGSARVHLKLEFDWGTKPVLDVIATMKGSTEPDVWIVRGNHYDGWVNGADDPISGQSGMLEEARALGELAKQGWRPKRTLIYAAWDGEEPGLIGSTEWAETHAE
jgi:N-acetylated-alpha-linked acidic dipeptidase